MTLITDHGPAKGQELVRTGLRRALDRLDPKERRVCCHRLDGQHLAGDVGAQLGTLAHELSRRDH